jgi:hypothetical protein
MDPLSIVASSIAVVQAADRVAGLLSNIKPFLEAANDLDKLIQEVAGLKILLSDLQSSSQEVLRLMSSSPERIQILESLVNEGLAVLLELERMIEYEFKRLPNQNAPGKSKVHRIRWLRKAGDVQKLKGQLLDVKSSISVQIGSTTLFVILSNAESELMLMNAMKAVYCPKPPYPG